MHIKTVLLCLLVLAQAGCVIVTDREDWEDFDNDSGNSWQHRQNDNHHYISSLALGMAMADVRTDLGAPDFTEGYRADDGRDFTILRYRTQHRRSDGATTQDETTPLVFENGQLIGWGDSVLNRMVQAVDAFPR